jgi:chaperonin GroEL
MIAEAPKDEPAGGGMPGGMGGDMGGMGGMGGMGM